MKKFVKLLIAAAVSCAVISGLAACGSHTHAPDEAWHADETSHWHVCAADGEVVESTRAAHTDEDDLLSDGTNHWHKCDVCDEIYGTTAHTAGTEWETDGTNHWHECTVCGAVVESTKAENKKITLPTYSTTAVYTGSALGCGLTSCEDYTVTYTAGVEEATPTNVGEYTVTVSLTDKEVTKWADGTMEDKTFTFEITAKSVTAPATTETTYKCNEDRKIDLLATGDDYTLANVKNNGTLTITATLKDKVNTKWADGTTEDKTYPFTVEHTYEWTTEGGVATGKCVENDGETKTLKLAVENRQDVVLNINDSGVSANAPTLDVSSIGKYASVEKIVFDGTTLAEGTLTIPAGKAITTFGEQNMVVTVKTEDGASHEITVPVLLITEEINDFARLKALVQITDVNCGEYQKGNYYTLGNNITITDDAGYNTTGINFGQVKYANGFAGTLDGKGKSIIGGKMSAGGLFGALKNATVKNVHFNGVKPNNSDRVSVISASIFNSTLDNVTITITGTADLTSDMQGIISSDAVVGVTLNKVTVNAENCSFKSIFGKGWDNANVKNSKIKCTDVVINVKSLQYITLDSNSKNEKKEISIGEVTGITGSMKAAVTPAEKFTVTDKGAFTLTLGDYYADATEVKSATYGEKTLSNLTIKDGVLSGTTDEFGLTLENVGTISFVINITSHGFDFALTVNVVVESGYDKVTLENSADLILANDVKGESFANTEITINLGDDYAGYAITGAIVGTTKLTVSGGKIVVDDVLKGVKAGAQTLTVLADNGVNYYEITMTGVVVTESITTFDRLKTLVQISSTTCGKFNDGKYFILGQDIELEDTTSYNTNPNGNAGAAMGNGFAGTLDGRDHSIIGGKMSAGGLFGSLQNATVKNIHFKDVQTYNNSTISVITGAMYNSVLDNVTVTIKGSYDFTGNKQGIISSNTIEGNITLNKVTVNAERCSFKSMFGEGWNSPDAKISCTEVVVNVKSLQCLAINSNTASDKKQTIEISEVTGITVNQATQETQA